MNKNYEEDFSILIFFASSCEKINEYSRYIRDSILVMPIEVRSGVDIRKYNDGAKYEKWIEVWDKNRDQSVINCWWFEIGLESDCQLTVYASLIDSQGDVIEEYGPHAASNLASAKIYMSSAVEWLISRCPPVLQDPQAGLGPSR